VKRTIKHIAVKRSGHVFVGNMIRSWCGDAIYKDLENSDPYKEIAFGSPDTFVIQTRDLLNWWASYTQVKGKVNTRMVTKWWEIAKAYHDCSFGTHMDVVRVNYEDFFLSRDYREGVCKALGGEYHEAALNRVALNGGGSSFSRDKFDGKAQEMKVLERYKQVKPQVFVALFTTYPALFAFYCKTTKDVDKLQFVKSL